MKQTKSHGLTGIVVPVIGALVLIAIALLPFADPKPQSQPTREQPDLQRIYVHIQADNAALATLGQFLSTRQLQQHEGRPPSQLRFADPALQRMIAVSDDGATWSASLYNGNQMDGLLERIVRYAKGSLSAGARQVPAPSYPHKDVSALSAGPSGVWFTTSGENLVGRLASDGTVVQYPSRFAGTLPDFPVTSPDGSVWFAELGLGKVAHLDRSGSLTEYPRQRRLSSVGPLAQDAGDNVWFLEPEVAKIGRIHLATGVISEYNMPEAGSQLTLIAAGPDKTVWFVDASRHALGKLDPASQEIAEYGQALQFSPKCLAVSGDGIVWFCAKDGLGRFDPVAHETRIIALPRPFTPNHITAGSRDDVWFTSGGGIGNTWGDGSIVRRYIPDYQATSYTVTTYTKDINAFQRKHPNYGGELTADESGPERRVVEYRDVSSDLTFYGISQSPDGTLWMIGDGALARFAPSTRRVTKFRGLSAESTIYSVIADHLHRLWLSEENRLIRFNTAGVIDRIIYPSQPGVPNDMAVGSDSSLWLALNGTIIHQQADGSSATYPIGEEGPFGIALSPAGQVWFTTRSHIARLQPSTGAIAIFALPYADAAPMAITALRDGSIWFTDAAGRIGKRSHDGRIEEFMVPTKTGIPFGLSSSGGGKLWFTEFYGAKIGVVYTATNSIREIAIPWSNSFPISIAVDNDGWVRFSDANGIFGTYKGTASGFQPLVIPTPIARGG